jgi:pimeloyl-ACP methyl ester carboxylesterase
MFDWLLFKEVAGRDFCGGQLMKNLIKIALAFVLVASLISFGSPAYAMIKVADNQVIVDKRDYPIIFIAGMGGSMLVRQDNKANIWLGTYHPTTDEEFKYLALKADGINSQYDVPLEAVKPLRMGGLNDIGAPIYQGFYDYMEKESLNLDTVMKGKSFFDFAYDFRQDNHRWTGDLDKKVDEVLKQTQSDKVILVGHSMGGIQARLYLADASRAKKVAAVVFMGTPHHGAVMPFCAMTNGYNFGNGRASKERMWEVMGNWEGGYQLLPDYPFVKDEKGVMHDIDWINNDDWISQQEYDHYIKDVDEGKKHIIQYGLPNHKFAAKTLAFHKELDRIKPASGVKYYMIEGVEQETVDYLDVKFENKPYVAKPVLHLEKHTSTKGDGTVPAEGAKIAGIQPVTVKSEHMSIPGNADAQKILTTIRQATNNESVRSDLVKKINTMAVDNIPKAKPAKPSATGESSLAEFAREIVLWVIRGRPDPEKQKLAIEIKDLTYQLLRDARANITISKGVDKNDPDKPDQFYLIAKNYQIIDVGTGGLKSANVKLIVDSYDVAIKALKNTDELTQAYAGRNLRVEGTGGIIDSINAKMLKWISKYFKFKG